MSLQTVSTKRNRVYQRRFDHEQAQAMRKAGQSYVSIAQQLGVSARAVARVCDPKVRARMNAEANAWATEHMRAPCRGGCGVLIWLTHKELSGFCSACRAVQSTADDERPGELRCTKCREWKPDAEFGRDKNRRTRRGHRPHCKACQAATRRDHRHRNIVRSREYERARRRQKQGTKEENIRMNNYIVLSKNGNGWEEIGRVEASSPVNAVEQVASDAGCYVGVAEGHIVDVEPVTVLKAVSRKNRKDVAGVG